MIKGTRKMSQVFGTDSVDFSLCSVTRKYHDNFFLMYTFSKFQSWWYVVWHERLVWFWQDWNYFSVVRRVILSPVSKQMNFLTRTISWSFRHYEETREMRSRSWRGRLSVTTIPHNSSHFQRTHNWLISSTTMLRRISVSRLWSRRLTLLLTLGDQTVRF